MMCTMTWVVKDTEDPESIIATVVFKVILTIGPLSCMVTSTTISGLAALAPESIGLKPEDSAGYTVVQVIAQVVLCLQVYMLLNSFVPCFLFF